MIELSPAARKFILHWGEMGNRWGVNRTVAQIHALLYVSPRPLNAEEMTETLEIARSNVSNSLRELQSFGIVKIVHVMGDRRDHFESMKDVWEMFQTIMDERKRRECDPTMAMLRECVEAAEKGGKDEAYTRERLSEMLDFFETMTTWYSQIRSLPSGAVIKFVKMGAKVRKLLGSGA
jgi:DNA-binding transcriptional regulator GbsR (MarR family)